MSAVFFPSCPLSQSPSLSLSPSVFTDLEVWKCSFTLPLLHKLLLYFLQLKMLLPVHFKWNKRVSCFRSTNLFHVLFGRRLCWPSSSQSVPKKNGNSLFWVLISCELLELFCASAHRGYWITAFFFLTNFSLSSLHFPPFSYFISFLYHSYFPPSFSISFQ